jgi:predicted small integral membrane protein
MRITDEGSSAQQNTARPRTTKIALAVQQLLAITLVVGVGVNELFHAIFDGMEFMGNVAFVGTVLSMEATFHEESWRALHSPAAAFVAYALIWVAHALAGVLSIAGGLKLARGIGSEALVLRPQWTVAIAGLGIACALYLIGFLTVASGWFSLHEAPTPPNFVSAAMNLFLAYMGVLIYITLITRDEPEAN